MAISRQKKEEVVKDLTEKLNDASSVFFVDYTGVSVPEVEDLRQKLRETEASFNVVKNTLIKRALDESEHKELKLDKFTGQTAVVVAGDDEVAPARVIHGFIKENKKMEILSGVLESQLLGKDKVKELALLPGKTEMLGKLVGTINAPVSGFVNVLAGNMRGLVNALNAIKDAKSA